MISRTCPECGELFYGRSDKKFCGDQCRNYHNNKLNSNCSNYVRNINNSLRKNRRILKKLIAGNTQRVPWQTLALDGFNFSYCTHIKPSADGKIYVYCYEYGYLLLQAECILIRHEQP